MHTLLESFSDGLSITNSKIHEATNISSAESPQDIPIDVQNPQPRSMSPRNDQAENDIIIVKCVSTNANEIRPAKTNHRIESSL